MCGVVWCGVMCVAACHASALLYGRMPSQRISPMNAASRHTSRKRPAMPGPSEHPTSLARPRLRLRAILDGLTDPFIYLDSRIVFRYLNPAAERMLQRSRKDLLGKVAGEIFPEALETVFSTECRRALEEQKPTSFETYYAPLRVWLETRVYPVSGGLALYLRDISEAKRVEGALRSSERVATIRAEELTTILEAMSDGVVVYNVEGEVVRANGAALALTGIDDYPDALQIPIKDRVRLYDMRDRRGNTLPRERWPLTRILNGEVLSGGNIEDVLLTTLDDEARELSVSGAPIRDAGGMVTEAVLVLRDVTARGELEREREQMLRMVSHELRAPLTIVRLATQLLESRLAKGEIPTRQQLSDLIEHLDRGFSLMERFVNDLVDVARLETGQLALAVTRCDLRQICEEVARDQAAIAGRAVERELPSMPVEVSADPLRLAQVLANLLSNALKYCPGESTVTLRLGVEGERVRVDVRDEGPGIPPDAIPHIFEQFYRVPGIPVQHGSSVGLGLGLYISRELIHLQGGELTVESKLGAGSTFSFTVPPAGSTH